MAWMDAENLWPALPGSWVLADHGEWLAIDKPTEVACPPGLERLGAAELPVRNDLFSRLRRAGLDASGALPLCTVFDPLDGDLARRPDAAAAVSGVCIVSRRPETTETLTRYELQGRVRLTSVVGVYGWPGDQHADRERRDVFARRFDGLGLTLRREQCRGPRALLTLQHTSGRSLNLTRDLRRLGLTVAAPDGGDLPAPRAPRLFVHRSEVAMPDETLHAPVPASFSRWLTDAEPEPFEDRLEAALRRRYVLGLAPDTTAFRLLDSVADDLTIDRYGPDIVLSSLVALHEKANAAEVRAELDAGLALARCVGERLGARSVYLKLRPRQANTVVDAHAAGLAPQAPVYGLQQGDAVEILEHGLRFGARLGGSLGTGIYLDQRDNRRWVRDHSAGLRVLNTFAYTCAFSVAAAAGGALRTVSIDAAATALAQGRLNFERNGVADAERHDLIRGDVFHWLPRLARRGDRFDLIVLDPPSYSRVKNRRFAAASDYADLVATALDLLAPGGAILACSNSLGVDPKRLHQMVRSGAHLAGRDLRAVQHRPESLDHPGGRMKALVARFD